MKSAFSNNPILIIDRAGLIGEPLSLKLSKEFSVVFVSKNPSAGIQFSGKVPTIPRNKYSHIIFIDEDGEDLELLPKVIEEVKSVNADFIFVQGLLSKSGHAVNKVLQMYPSSKVVIFGDVFGKELILKQDSFGSTINKFIYHAQKFGRIQVLGEGLKEAYPVFMGDVVDGLINIVFGVHRPHSLFYIFPKYPPSELSLAHMIQKFNPEIVVDFVRHDLRTGNIAYPQNGKYLLADNYPLAQKIRSIDIKKNPFSQSAGGKKAESKVFGRGKAQGRSFPLFVIWILIFLFFSPLIFTSVFSFLGLSTFDYAKREIDKGNFSNSKSSIHLSQVFFSAGKQTASILVWQGRLLGLKNNFKQLSEDINYGHKISESLSQIFSSEVYFSKILSGKSENPAADLAKGEGYLNGSIVALNKIRAEGKIPAQISQNLEILNPLIKLLSNTQDVIPNILGMEGPKTYLVLFQNNLELRPGGGFVGSYGVLKLDMGKITQFVVHDTYDADEQLRGHVEPPFAIRRYLLSEHWYMRDSNFDIDFAGPALSSSDFLFAETGEKADGVIALDVAFIKGILHAIGPVSVSDYGEYVDENNLYRIAQTYPEKNFYPGYAQKKDFLRSLNREIMTRLSEGDVPYLSIAQAISDALSQKHLLFMFDSDYQNIFTVNGWSSSLWDERIGGEENVNDFVGINEANIGINKVNYIIERLMSQRVELGNDGKITEELTVSFKNRTLVLPGGDYKNYLRVILPKGVQLSEISIDDTPQVLVDAITDPLKYEAKNFKAPPGLEVEKVIEKDKTIIGFIVNVPADKFAKVKLKYMLPGNIANLNTFSYNMDFFKQPGVDNIPYSLGLIYPDSFNIIKSSDKISGEEGSVLYSENMIADKNLILNFAKK